MPLLIIFIIFLIFTFSFLSIAPWVPTKRSDLTRINQIIKLEENEDFLEIGCGTANVSIFIAKKNPKNKIVGIELSPILYIISKFKVFLYRIKNVKIIYGNALNIDLKKFDAIYIFGMPEAMTKKIFPKLKEVKNRNFRLISYCFQMKNNYFKETKYKEKNNFAIYEYKIGQI